MSSGNWRVGLDNSVKVMYIWPISLNVLNSDAILEGASMRVHDVEVGVSRVMNREIVDVLTVLNSASQFQPTFFLTQHPSIILQAPNGIHACSQLTQTCV